MGAYTRIQVEGHTLNQRTAGVYAQVKKIYPLIGGTGHLILEQGSYNTGGVAASAGTHNGGGAMDIIPSIDNPHNWACLQKARRMCMEAAWDRPTLPGHWYHHDHGIVIGDVEAAPLAKQQVKDYYAHDSGLVGEAHDPSWRPNVLFSPSYPLGTVNLSNMVKFSKTPNKLPRPGVFAIQRALNLKHGNTLKVNGIFNAATKRAFADYEKVIGGNGDGVPGIYSLSILGAGRFNVV